MNPSFSDLPLGSKIFVITLSVLMLSWFAYFFFDEWRSRRKPNKGLTFNVATLENGTDKNGNKCIVIKNYPSHF